MLKLTRQKITSKSIECHNSLNGYANHLKVLQSEVVVLNVQAKGVCKSSGKCKEAEPK